MRTREIVWIVGIAAALGAVAITASVAGTVNDVDGDGVPDAYDNCVLEPNGPLAGKCRLQQDGDEDGFGNACDADFNNDGAWGIDDISYMLAEIGSTEPQLDLNCDGAAGVDDLSRMLENLGAVPGPSGLPCQDSNASGLGTCPPY